MKVGFASSLILQWRVFGALVLREVVVRYGRKNIGFLWLIVEPLILCTGVMIIWSFIKHDSHAVPLVSFILTGYMPLTLWRHISSHGVSCLRQNAPLFYHRQVKPLDALIARAVMEALGTTIALIAVYTTLRLTGLVDPYVDMGLIVGGWLLMAWLAFAVGLVLAALSETVDYVEKLVSPFQYLMLPISGCFFMVAWLPTWVQELSLYVPTVHCYEMFRAGMLGETVDTYYDAAYLAMWCIVLTLAGLILVQRASEELELE